MNPERTHVICAIGSGKLGLHPIANLPITPQSKLLHACGVPSNQFRKLPDRLDRRMQLAN
jgi:hypothetical protein